MQIHADQIHFRSRFCTGRLRNSLTRVARRSSPIFLATVANDAVGPFQRSSSTFLKSGASIRSVARSLKSSARSRLSSFKIPAGKLFDVAVPVDEGRGCLCALSPRFPDSHQRRHPPARDSPR